MADWKTEKGSGKWTLVIHYDKHSSIHRYDLLGNIVVDLPLEFDDAPFRCSYDPAFRIVGLEREPRQLKPDLTHLFTEMTSIPGKVVDDVDIQISPRFEESFLADVDESAGETDEDQAPRDGERLEEIREALERSRKLGEQAQGGIDALMERTL